MTEAHGQPLDQAFAAFLSFVGSRPLFFHNADFDEAFLKRASRKTGLKFKNLVCDSLFWSQDTWPALKNHKLSTLAAHVGGPAPGHRALTDARALLMVVLTAMALCAP